MKFNRDNKYLLWGITAFCVIAASMMFFLLVTGWDSMSGIFTAIGQTLSPIVIGIVIAYLLSPILDLLENLFLRRISTRLFGKNGKKAATFSRTIATILSILIFILFFAGLIMLVIPKLVSSAEKLVANLDRYITIARDWVNDFFSADSEIESAADSILSSVIKAAGEWVESTVIARSESIVISVGSGVLGFARALINFLIGMITSVYLLYNKEGFQSQIKKLLTAVLPQSVNTRVLNISREIHHVFGGFLIGKIVASLIVGVVTAIFMSATNMPYSALISVLVAVTNVIPFVGPFIGAVPSAFLIALENPVQCVVFVIFIFILQQLDGNILSAKILGATTGLSGFWVIFSILIGGALFGFMGMLIGVPVFAVIYHSLRRAVNRRVESKKAKAEDRPPGI
ncbi:MAG: AI-2E family transporter [Oscillospiraceae bacterium]|jgi:predicted PurR-regulated permease PerM|nr:AI-2E family transporter [Oscillospiraceae bacterium]